jgi:hypothetical protein
MLTRIDNKIVIVRGKKNSFSYDRVRTISTRYL